MASPWLQSDEKDRANSREEQNKIGAQEMLMPTIQSADIWKESGRYKDYGEMLRIKDRQGREMLYGPTNEELITEILGQVLNLTSLFHKFFITFSGNLEMK